MISIDRTRAIVAACLVSSLALLHAPVAAGQDVTLAYRWTSGETTRYRIIQQTTSTITGLPGGMPDVTVEQLASQVFKTTVDSVAADGATKLQQAIESMHMEFDTPMGKFGFDSANPGAGSGHPVEATLKDIFSSLIGATFTLTLTPSGTIQSVEGASAVLEKLSSKVANDPMSAPMLESLRAGFSDEAIKAMFSQGFAEFPPRAVKQGETWERTMSIPNPMLGALTNTTTSTLTGVEGAPGAQVAKIATTVALKQDSATTTAVGPMGMTAALKDASGDGEMLFDVSKGRLQRGTTRVTLPMTMSGNGPDGTPMTMQTNAKTTVTIELIEK